jgi:hypothetical protein
MPSDLEGKKSLPAPAYRGELSMVSSELSSEVDSADLKGVG